MSDIWLDELDKVLAEETDASAPLADILDPFIRLLTCTPNPASPKRLQEAMFDPLVETLSLTIEEAEPSRKKRKTSDQQATDAQDQGRYPHIARHCVAEAGATDVASRQELLNSVLKRMIKLASLDNSQGVKDANRRRVYNFVREWGGVDDEDDDDE